MLSEQEITAIFLSLKVALFSIISGLVPAIFFAYILARFNFRGKSVLDSVIHLPLVIPPVVTGYFLMLTIGKHTLIGGFFESIGIRFAFNWKGAVAASVVMGFPLLVRPIRLSIESINKELEDAARMLGASNFKVFMTVTLPLAVHGIISGSILAFARSLGEFGATITFVSNIQGETQTLPLALYSYTQTPGGEAMAARLCLISVFIALAALVASNAAASYAKKKIEG